MLLCTPNEPHCFVVFPHWQTAGPKVSSTHCPTTLEGADQLITATKTADMLTASCKTGDTRAVWIIFRSNRPFYNFISVWIQYGVVCMLMLFLFVFVFCSHLEEATKSHINVTVTSKKSTDTPVSEFQDFVSDMQKTITSLRKQVNSCIRNLEIRSHVIWQIIHVQNSVQVRVVGLWQVIIA